MMARTPTARRADALAYFARLQRKDLGLIRERLDIENQAALAPWLAREAEQSQEKIPTQIP